MHHFLLHDDAEDLFMPAMVKRINKKARTIQDTFGFGHWTMNEVHNEIRRLIQGGYYDGRPQGYGKKMDEILRDHKKGIWRMTDVRGGTREESMDEHDILLVGGVIAADVLKPGEFWADHPGFASASDVHATIGIMAMRNRDLFFDDGGHTWESMEGDDRFKTRITGSQHGDLRIERVRTTDVATIDPFGNTVHYHPVSSADRQTVAAYHSCEPALLAAVLKYADQQKADVPCLEDGGRAFLKELQKKGQIRGNFGDFGGNSQNPAPNFSSFAFPMNDARAERSTFWHLTKEHHDAHYRIHVDTAGRLAFSSVDKKGVVAERPSLALPASDMEEFIRGIFLQAQKGRGRTSVAELAQILAYRFSPGFEDEMARIREMFERK